MASLKEKYQIWFYILFTCILIHIATSIWIFSGRYVMESDPESENWIKSNDIPDNEMGELYLQSFYFIIMTVTTVGYGG